MPSIGDAGIAPRRIAKGRKCGAFAGVCVVLLLLSGSIMGLAMMASGQTFSDLALENDMNWKVKDVTELPNQWAIQVWDYRFPELNGDVLEFEFNDAEDGWFTVYLDNVWEGDLTGMKVRAVFQIEGNSEDPPVFVARRPDAAVQICLNFQTTGGAYEPSDLWWSEDYKVLTTYTTQSDGTTIAFTDPLILNIDLVLEVELDVDNWFNYDGASGDVVEDSFNAAIQDIHEIGFTFGRSESVTSGIALTYGDATFVLKSFELLPA